MPRSAQTCEPRDDDLLTFMEACEHFTRAHIKPATLEAAIAGGRLEYVKLGRRRFVTFGAMKAWIESCRVAPQVHDFTSIRNEIRGSSETDQNSSGLAAALETVEMLKNFSKPTLGRSTHRRRAITRA